jgi:hypothetical protein
VARKSKKATDQTGGIDVAAVRLALSHALGPLPQDEHAAKTTGFQEANTTFDVATVESKPVDQKRFAESVRLARAFALVEDVADRQLLIAATEALAGLQRPTAEKK